MSDINDNELLPLKKGLKPQDLLLRFVDSLGHKRDAEVYLKLFSAKEVFAILVLDEENLREEMETIIFHLRYLMRLELYPVVVIQAPSQVLIELDVEGTFKKAKLDVALLNKDIDQQAFLDFVKERIKKDNCPVFYVSPDENLVPKISEMVNLLKTTKVIFFNKLGGLFDLEAQQVINLVSLRAEKDNLLNSNKLNFEDKIFLKQCDELIQLTKQKVFISLVSPFHLLRELFTVKGAGTMVQMGSQIYSFTSWKEVDKEKLKLLLETSFQKSIQDDFFKKRFDQIYIEENYLGAALMVKYGDMSYLSKFAVGTEARGLGIGRDLWEEILKNHQKVFWRSDPKKFITSWYTKQCDGMQKTPQWTIFWKGLDQAQINKAIDLALKKEVDFY